MRTLHAVEQSNESFQNQSVFQSFYNQGMEAYDNILYDEIAAKEAVLMAYMARGAVLLSGGPGGGKSTLAINANRIYSDYGSQDTACVPPDASLTAIQLVGGTMEASKVISDSNGERIEKTLTTVQGLITPTTKDVFVDEGTRVNPLAMNSLLAVLQEKILKTTAGDVALDDLMLLLTTMNPSETRQATFKMSTALAGRHATGAVMGRDLTAANGVKIVNGISPDPNKIVPFTTSRDVRRMHEAVKAHLLPETEAELAYRVGIAAINYLEETHGISEENRILKQIGMNAKIHGLFRGRNATPEDVHAGLKFVLAARIGALVAGPDPIEKIETAHDTILGQAA